MYGLVPVKLPILFNKLSEKMLGLESLPKRLVGKQVWVVSRLSHTCEVREECKLD